MLLVENCCFFFGRLGVSLGCLIGVGDFEEILEIPWDS
jgi:hypothetical protein